ncbi:MAG: circularly permuted type 2 ATP-grasp protein [Akkermansiaceae bacterium]|nr:circularly permuted type 2 ATP-grasp protein [Akkermansiaceae bacterium]
MKWTTGLTGFDEAFTRDGKPRPHYKSVVQALGALTDEQIQYRGKLQEISARNQGITFNVYGSDEGEERVFPFDFVPRIIPAKEWNQIERGLIQRTTAINLFLLDVYSDQKCLKDGLLPYDLVLSRSDFRRELQNVQPPHKVYTHVVGSDLIRDDKGTYLVLEDNCRCPSGVSYVVQNRTTLQRTFPELFNKLPVRPVRNYADLLREALEFMAPRGHGHGLTVVLTPGRANSAYFEHSFLAREMGVLLVEGNDLIVEDNFVYVRTTAGKKPVDVIYRRIDDEFLDPLSFRKDSILGVPGLINAYRSGNVALANAPGAGVADDKAIYPFIPAIIKYFLDEDPIIEQVPTYMGFRKNEFTYILANLDKLVVKRTDGSGGYGMLMGPQSTEKERQAYAANMKKAPGSYIAQPLVEISAHPTYLDGAYKARRLDLRPYVLYGDRIKILPGGLTRVALTEGSYVVNSSQGGGSKDTWVLMDTNDKKKGTGIQ